MTLTDGTEVRVQLVGDEFMRYYVSEDNYSTVMDATTGQGKRSDCTCFLVSCEESGSPSCKGSISTETSSSKGESKAE